MASTSGRDHGAQLCDTNVLVRLLTKEPEDQALAAARALEAGSSIVLTDAVVAEVCYVMTRVAGAPRVDVADRLAGVMGLPSVVVTDRAMLLDALRIWTESRVGFVDAYLAAFARRLPRAAVLSFDRGFDRIEGVERVDPSTY